MSQTRNPQINTTLNFITRKDSRKPNNVIVPKRCRMARHKGKVNPIAAKR